MKAKNFFSFLAIALLAIFISNSNLSAQTQINDHGNKFVDVNGDGYNDNAPDADNDGIPNGRDEDYTGTKTRNGNSSKGFIDLNGDGINDRAIDSDGDGIVNGQDADFVRPQDGSGQKLMNGKNYKSKFGENKFGPGDGTGNSGVGPKDGTGYGPGSGTGTGVCDGTGPKGYSRGGRNK